MLWRITGASNRNMTQSKRSKTLSFCTSRAVYDAVHHRASELNASPSALIHQIVRGHFEDTSELKDLEIEDARLAQFSSFQKFISDAFEAFEQEIASQRKDLETLKEQDEKSAQLLSETLQKFKTITDAIGLDKSAAPTQQDLF